MRGKHRRHRLAGPGQLSGERGLLAGFVEPEHLIAVQGDISFARCAELHARVVAVIAIVKDRPRIAGFAQSAGNRRDRLAASEHGWSVAGPPVRHRADRVQAATAAQRHLRNRPLSHDVRANEATFRIEHKHVRIAGRGKRADGDLRAILGNIQASDALLRQQADTPRIPGGTRD